MLPILSKLPFVVHKIDGSPQNFGPLHCFLLRALKLGLVEGTENYGSFDGGIDIPVLAHDYAKYAQLQERPLFVVMVLYFHLRFIDRLTVGLCFFQDRTLEYAHNLQNLFGWWIAWEFQATQYFYWPFKYNTELAWIGLQYLWELFQLDIVENL